MHVVIRCITVPENPAQTTRLLALWRNIVPVPFDHKTAAITLGDGHRNPVQVLLIAGERKG